MEQLEAFFRTPIGTLIVNLFWALMILLIGYLIAKLITGFVQKLLKRFDLDKRVSTALSEPDKPQSFNLENVISKIVFWLIMLFAIVAALDRLNLTAVVQPLSLFLNSVMVIYLPRLLGALTLLAIAWLIATALRFLIRKTAAHFKLDERLNRYGGREEGDVVGVSEPLATAVFWFVFLLFLPDVLNALGLNSVAAPIQGIFEDIFGYIPNVLGASLIFLFGWFAAYIIRQVVTNFLAAIGLDKYGQKIGLSQGRTLSGIIGYLLYVFILLVVVISALEQLNITAISEPATRMLDAIVAAIPALLGATAILIIAYFIGRVVANLVRDVLTNLEFNSLPERLGIKWAGERTPAEWVGWLTLIVIMLFAATSAVELIGSEFLVAAFGAFIQFLLNLTLGLVIFAIGLYFANLVYNVINSTKTNNAHFIAQMGRVAIIIFAAALGLGQLGIAESIVNLAFGIMLGAIGVAIALAFGLGSREIAGREVENFISALRAPEDESEEPAA
jgi:hypothetical protein